MIEKKMGPATRDAYGKALAELGQQHPDIVVLDGDLSKSTKTEFFAAAFPNRFFNVGICEANMVGMASGLAGAGMTPFISSFACFVICKGYDQLRMAVCFSEAHVKIVASHGGISVGEDGASQQSIEDFALAMSLPGMVVLNPADAVSTRPLVFAAYSHPGPVYMRTGRPKAPLIYREGDTLEIGKGVVLRPGKDAVIFATGLEVYESLVAADSLSSKGLDVAVVDIHTLKPLDEPLIAEWARRTGAVVTAEEHQIWGGLGSAVARVLGQRCPVPVEMVAIQDTYAESGGAQELLEKYQLTAPYIAKAVEAAVARKTR